MFSRRQVIQAFGLAAAGSISPAWLRARAEIPSSIACEQNRVQMIDADFAVTNYVEKIKDAGVRTVGRYYDGDYGTGPSETCWHNPTKKLAKQELKAIEDAGLAGVFVFG